MILQPNITTIIYQKEDEKISFLSEFFCYKKKAYQIVENKNESYIVKEIKHHNNWKKTAIKISLSLTIFIPIIAFFYIIAQQAKFSGKKVIIQNPAEHVASQPSITRQQPTQNATSRPPEISQILSSHLSPKTPDSPRLQAARGTVSTSITNQTNPPSIPIPQVDSKINEVKNWINRFNFGTQDPHFFLQGPRLKKELKEDFDRLKNEIYAKNPKTPEAIKLELEKIFHLHNLLQIYLQGINHAQALQNPYTYKPYTYKPVGLTNPSGVQCHALSAFQILAHTYHYDYLLERPANPSLTKYSTERNQLRQIILHMRTNQVTKEDLTIIKDWFPSRGDIDGSLQRIFIRASEDIDGPHSLYQLRNYRFKDNKKLFRAWWTFDQTRIPAIALGSSSHIWVGLLQKDTTFTYVNDSNVSSGKSLEENTSELLDTFYVGNKREGSP